MPFPWKKAGLRTLAILLPLIAPAQPPSVPEGSRALPRQVLWTQRDERMVDIAKVCPGICIELRYATERNFTGKQVYPLHARALVRKSVAARLRKVQDALRKQGYGLKIWDAYRPRLGSGCPVASRAQRRISGPSFAWRFLSHVGRIGRCHARRFAGARAENGFGFRRVLSLCEVRIRRR